MIGQNYMLCPIFYASNKVFGIFGADKEELARMQNF